MKKVKIEVMLQGYGDSHFATSVEEIIEVDDNAPIDDLWAKRIYVEEVTATDKLSVEKLQEQLHTAKKYIEHVIGTIKHDGHLGTIQTDWILPDLEKALAAIGGDK
ncbi:hypothetical protein EFN96_07180 [Lactococcus cremoris]|uniref:hypothetical protein n=1 Tax=Lactococcus lactis subsp. cremoris TaxID=1359 RepID=UPI0021A98EA8|nr:hypothetical protein [Lactococcus cremoris]MCT4406710.1 hypothetical protein [Lactococcus cremoris]